MEYRMLNNGVKMPILGYGVFQIPLADTERCVLKALSVGYRMIDTAQGYFNEEGVGTALQKSGIPRVELFLTTKVWVSNAGENKAAASIDASLKKLKTDYVDLLLIHQPFGDYYGTYRAMETAMKAGKVRALGVSNFLPDRFIDLAEFNEIVPAINQLEAHAFQQQKEARKILDRYQAQLIAWAPMAEGKNNLFTNPVLTRIGQKYGKTAAQIDLRFLIQSGVIVIPKSTHFERMRENFDLFDFTLTTGEMEKIGQLDTGASLFIDHQAPETVDMFVSTVKQKGND